MAASTPGCNGVLEVEATASACWTSSSLDESFCWLDDPLIVATAAGLDFLIPELLTTGVLTIFMALGVGLVVHCHLPLASIHDWPSFAVA